MARWSGASQTPQTPLATRAAKMDSSMRSCLTLTGADEVEVGLEDEEVEVDDAVGLEEEEDPMCRD